MNQRLELSLATCGCAFPEFVCVTCKKKYTCIVDKYQDVPPSLITKSYTPGVYNSPVSVYRFRYYKFNWCTKIFKPESEWCPKCVCLQPNPKYICGWCKIESIDELFCIGRKRQAPDPILQTLLELNV